MQKVLLRQIEKEFNLRDPHARPILK